MTESNLKYTEQQYLELAEDFKNRFGNMKEDLLSANKLLMTCYGMIRCLDMKIDDLNELNEIETSEIKIYSEDLRELLSNYFEKLIGVID